MPKNKSGKIVGRLGVRYGRTVRMRLGQIEAGLRGKHRCQNCGSMKVKRVSVGVWNCSKCGITFSGGAYSPSSSPGEIARRNVRKEI